MVHVRQISLFSGVRGGELPLDSQHVMHDKSKWPAKSRRMSSFLVYLFNDSGLDTEDGTAEECEMLRPPSIFRGPSAY